MKHERGQEKGIKIQIQTRFFISGTCRFGCQGNSWPRPGQAGLAGGSNNFG